MMSTFMLTYKDSKVKDKLLQSANEFKDASQSKCTGAAAATSYTCLGSNLSLSWKQSGLEPGSYTSRTTACSDDASQTSASPRSFNESLSYLSSASYAISSLPLPLAKDTIVIRDVSVRNPNLRPSLLSMVNKIQSLSLQCFNEDVTTYINRKSGWKIHLLVPANELRLLGFLSYKIRNGVFEIAKLAICDDCRHLGYGRRLVKCVIADAKQNPHVDFVALSSLAEAVSFYAKLGFKQHTDVKFGQTTLQENEIIIPGQIYMEIALRKNKRQLQHKRNK